MTGSLPAPLSGLEHLLIGAGGDAETLPPLVFLHEGLGSISRWKRFPSDVREACGGPRTLVYSRYGYGGSAARETGVAAAWMQEEAVDVLPRLLDHLELPSPILIGHSDGATIAAMHAAAGFSVAGLVLIAPHLFLESCTLAGVRAAQEAFLDESRLQLLARHHKDPRGVVTRWCDAWLSEEMAGWSLEPQLSRIVAPVLVVQGTQDPYGTTAQVHAAQRGCPDVEVLVLDGVGHEPHFEVAERTASAIATFVRRVTAATV